MEAFSQDKVQLALGSLPSHRHRLAFAAGVCERLLPNYDAFSREVAWGDPTLLRRGLAIVWRVVQGGTVRLAEIRELQAMIRAVTPDTEDFGSPLTSAALDASSAVHEALEACFRDEPRRIAEIATLARDTVDMYVRERDDLHSSDPLFQQRILVDPLMVRELEKQRSDLNLLTRTQLDADFVRRYREGAQYGGKSSIDIS